MVIDNSQRSTAEAEYKSAVIIRSQNTEITDLLGQFWRLHSKTEELSWHEIRRRDVYETLIIEACRNDQILYECLLASRRAKLKRYRGYMYRAQIDWLTENIGPYHTGG